MKKLLLIVNIIFFLCITNVCSVIASDESLVKPIEVFHLPNGQTLVVQEVHTNPIVTVDTWINTGSINEDDENNGVAHFLEHLIFKGTEKHVAGSIDEILESKGADFNAATSKDYTHFYVTIASDYFEQAVELHSDMLLNAIIPPEELIKERKVVVEEIRRADDNPDREVFRGLNTALFKKHPYKYDTLGTADIIENISREKILEYYHKWYIPSNMITVVIGDVDADTVRKVVEKNFNSLPSETMPRPTYKEEPFLKTTVEKIEKGDYKQAYLEFGFRAPSMNEADKTYAFDLAAIIMGQGASSRLYKKLKLDENLVDSIYVSNYPMKDKGMFIIDVRLQPENLAKVKQIIVDEVNKFKTELVSNEELTRVKNQMAREFIYNNESVANIAYLAGYNMIVATLDEYTDYLDKINGVTPQDIMDRSKQYLNTEAMAVSILTPDVEIPESVASEEKTIEPANISVSAPLDDAYCYNLENGIKLIVKPSIANDIVNMNVYIKGGKLLQVKPGLAELTTELLLKGTTSRTAEQIANETDNKGIQISAEAYDDYIQVSIKSTKNDFPEAFMVLSDVLKNPVFDQVEIDKVKTSMINAVNAIEDSPMSFSLTNLQMNLYKNHPYGDLGPRVAKELPSITREEIIDFYKKNYVPSNMVIATVGNVPKDIVKRYVEQSWAKDNIVVDDNYNHNQSKVEKNETLKIAKDTEAAWITLGWIAPDVESEDYAALKVIDSVLSGGLSARLPRVLREEKPLAYNVGTFYPSRIDDSIFVMYISTAPKNINIVMEGFKEQIKRLQEELVSEDELNKVKQKMVGKFALAHETNSQQAFYLGFYECAGVGYEFDEKYPEIIKNVTADQIQAVAKKIFNNPSILSVVAPQKDLDLMKE
ncbi:MAG: M16 family metallopeptidase [Vampirovibrionia bacterium]